MSGAVVGSSGLDIGVYGARGVPFHVLGLSSRLRGLVRSARED